MEPLALILFCGALLVCILLDFSILYALGLGLVIFLLYGLYKGFSPKELLFMCLEGIRTARNILITFFLIGILTALWRCAGTIPVLVCYAAALIRPSVFLLMTFLLNCVVSLLTGTSFGTAATMGVICATMGSAMNISPFLVGGAILSGAFFGDRCSPISTSALLVTELTHTNIFDNLRRLLKTALVPFLLTCFVYLFIGLVTPHSGTALDLAALFGQEIRLHWIALLPAALILILSLCRVKVKAAMLVSIAAAVLIGLFFQHRSIASLAWAALLGYRSQDPAAAALLDGGGAASMLNGIAIVCLSSAYSGIFQRTGLLEAPQKGILWLSERITAFGSMLCASILSGAIACNQTLAIMLTHQLCKDTEKDRQTLAIGLENSAVVVAPLIPWSIASGVPLASTGTPTSSILFAVFLYLLPLWNFSLAVFHKKWALTSTNH